jgi:hypothetical protein
VIGNQPVIIVVILEKDVGIVMYLRNPPKRQCVFLVFLKTYASIPQNAFVMHSLSCKTLREHALN